MKAVELLNNSILPLHKTDKVATALHWMNEYKLNHLPIVDHKKYLGLISNIDLLDKDDPEETIGKYSKTLIRPHISADEHYYYALKIMADFKVTALPVIDENAVYLGLITQDILIQNLSESLSVQNPGGIIILEINQLDFSLGEIVRIVESNDTKILSTSIKTKPDSTLIEVTIKLNRVNIEAVLQTFSRFHYEIKAYYGENENDEDLLRERYNSLMTYLNI
jgi:CBS domain-containing protein